MQRDDAVGRIGFKAGREGHAEHRSGQLKMIIADMLAYDFHAAPFNLQLPVADGQHKLAIAGILISSGCRLELKSRGAFLGALLRIFSCCSLSALCMSA